MILAARMAPSLDDQSMALLFQSGHAVDRQDQRLFVEEQRIASDRLGGRLKVGARRQLHIDIALNDTLTPRISAQSASRTPGIACAARVW